MKILKLVLLIINLLLLINSLHFLIFALFPFLMRKKEDKEVIDKKNKFMILIAARNEEKVIGNLIDSLNKQNYDKKLYQICVLPNNCIDNTKKVAKEKGCLVIEPNFNPKTKGEVLNYAFNYFKNDNDFTAYIVFDADNIVDSNFLAEINNKLNKGYNIVQGFRDTKNLYSNVMSGSYGLFFHLQNLFLYTSRSRIGESSTLNGTGYSVSKKYIDNLNTSFKTVTEDIELTTLCAINNQKIGFERQAIFYDEQVENFLVSIKQRKRWIQGSMQVFKYFIGNLFTSIKGKNTFQVIDMINILFLPINQAIAFFIMIITYLVFVPFYLLLPGLVISYFGEVILSVFLTIFYHKKLSKLFGACLFFPIFHLSWIPIYIYSLFNTKNKWEEIKHTKSLKIEDIIDN